MSLSISSTDQALAEAAATEIETIMADGASVGITSAIPATTGFQATDNVRNFFKASAAGILRRLTTSTLVYASATAGAQSFTGSNAANTVNFGTVIKDTANAITTGASWVWKCPVGQAGLYHVNTMIAVTSPTSGDNAELSLWKVSTLGADAIETVLSAVRTPPVGGSIGSYLPGSSYIELLENEGIRIKVKVSNIASQSLVSATGNNWIRITRVGNIS